jgi:hypothetical protein
MQFVWSEYPQIDDANRVVFAVTVDGTLVNVYIAQDAEDERGLALCKAMAERRLHAAKTKGWLPRTLHIEAADFSLNRGRS